jgi:acetyl-CoA acetyltransferase
MWEHSKKIAVAGVGFSAIERRTSTPLGSYALAAARAAAEDSGIDLADVDGLATYPDAPFAGAKNEDGADVITPEFFLSSGLLPQVAWYSQAGAGLVATAMREATNALLAGACTYALVWRAMYTPPGTYGRADQRAFGGDAQFAAPWGLTSPVQWHALAYRRYLEEYGADSAGMATMVLNSRANANLNDHAYFREQPLSLDEYASARMISDPLRLFDCDVPVTACVAVILTTAERARELRNPPALIASIGQQAVSRRPSLRYVLSDHIESGRPVADQLWNDAGLGPSDMDAAQLYDGFSPSALYWLEAAGFCGRGEALDFIQGGRIERAGELPVNTFGGSLSQGRLHGMGHIVEAVLQVTDRGGARQLPGASAVCVFDGSPMLRGGGMVIVRDS